MRCASCNTATVNQPKPQPPPSPPPRLAAFPLTCPSSAAWKLTHNLCPVPKDTIQTVTTKKELRKICTMAATCKLLSLAFVKPYPSPRLRAKIAPDAAVFLAPFPFKVAGTQRAHCPVRPTASTTASSKLTRGRPPFISFPFLFILLSSILL